MTRADEMEEQLRLLQEAGRLKAEALARLSHDLRTPLSAIIGFAEMMHDAKVGPVSAHQKEFLEDILTSSRQILGLLDQVLDPAPLDPAAVDLAPVDMPKAEAGKGAAAAGESILVVDDSAVNRKLALMLLSREGYEVRTAQSADEAVAALRDFAPRLVLMDLQMPGIDGFQLTRRLRSDPAMQKVLIVALSAYSTPADEDKARAAGCDDYVSKPIDTRTLPAVIARLLRKAATDGSP
jgi:two-component system, cell cycle response regulator DivK